MAEDVIAERVQVTMVVAEGRVRRVVADAIGVALVAVLALSERGDRLPIGRLERTVGRVVESSGGGWRILRAGRALEHLFQFDDEPADAVRVVGSTRKRRQPILERVFVM